MDGGARRDRWSLGPSLVMVLAVVATAWWIGRDLWFFSDDWNIYADFHTSASLLDPFNGHLSLVPVAAYQSLFATLGVGAYWPYRLVGLVGYGLLGYQVAAFARPRVGSTGAALAVTFVVWSSAASTTVMFPFLVNYSLPVAAMVAIWRRLDRDDLGADVGGSVWLAVALATSGLGVMTALATLTELAWRRAPARRWLVYAPGPALWTVWYLANRDANEVSDDLGRSLRYAARMLFGGARALAAGWGPGGVVVTALLVVVGLLALLRWRTAGPHAAGAAVALAAFVGSTALTRLDILPPIPPDEIRYRWAVATYLVLLVVALVPRPRIATARSVTAAGLTALGALALAGAVVGVDGMRDWTDTSVAGQPGLRAVLAAVEIVGDAGDPDVVIPLSYVPVTAGAYLDARAAVGSPLAGRTLDVAAANPDQASYADHYLVDQGALAFAVGSTDGCAPLVAGTSLAPGAVVGAEGAAGAGVRLSRFGPAAEAPILRIPAGGRGVLRLPPDPPDLDAGSVAYRLVTEAGVALSTCAGD